jgi:hypothetical protein
MLLAKSAGISGRAETLFDHSRNVVLMARQLYARLPSVVKSQDGQGSVAKLKRGR